MLSYRFSLFLDSNLLVLVKVLCSLTLIRVFWKKNPIVGNSWERHLWKKNPDYYHDDLPIKIENLTFWEIPRASFLEKKSNQYFWMKMWKINCF